MTSEDTFIKNYSLFISLYETRTTDEKKANIERCLDDGANVNAKDANNRHNTPLHIAVQKGEREIVQLLIERGAIVNEKNSAGKSPLELANNLIDTNNRDAIVALLRTGLETCNQEKVIASNLNERVNIGEKRGIKQSKQQKKEFLYPKRPGTSGVCGQLYETKLLSLVLLRALNDKHIQTFHLGTNISGIGALDDICMRYEVKEHANPIMVFVQAKHREDREKNRLTVEDVCNETGDFSLPKYFDSYLRIKDSFRPNNEDDLFKGELNNVECNFIIYTPAKDDFKRKRSQPNEQSIKVNELIQTGPLKDFFQYEHNEHDVAFLTKMTVEDRIKKLGPTFLHFILAEKDKTETMMTDELIKRYHVVLGREVVQVLDTESNQDLWFNTSEDLPIKTVTKNTESKLYNRAKFRPEFFTSRSGFIVCLRETFYKEISSTRCDKTLFIKDEISNSIENILLNPCASNINKAISKTVIFNEKTKTLEVIETNNIKKAFKSNRLTQVKQNLIDITIDDETIREAIKIKLESMEFKLPTSFGNIDMTIRGSGAKSSKRLDEIADKVVEKILRSGSNTNRTDDYIEVEISDKTIGSGKDQITQGFIDINGGIGGAVGNALILDEKTKMLKFDTKNRQPPKANEFLEMITKRIGIHELDKYRIRMNINGFPKYSFDGDEYDVRQAKEFLNKLWFYTNQAKEDEVESILKNEINKHYNTQTGNNQFVFRIHSDAIFLRSHDEIQKWWMQTGKAPYLTNANEFFEQAIKDVIDSPLLTVLNFMYLNRIKKLDVQFNEAAIQIIELNNNPEGLYNIITESNVLSGIKIMQYFQMCDSYMFIDFDYVLSLPLNDYNTMIHELACTKLQNLVIMYESLKYYEGFCNKLKQIIKTFVGKRTVIVTDSILADELKKEYNESMKKKYTSVSDNNTYLIDLNKDSQNKILEDTRIIFQGEELPLASVVDQKTRSLIRTELLDRIVNGEKIELGHTLLDQTYKDVREYYVDRHLKRDETIQVNTLNDINDKIVVVSGNSGMGKSSLLTHLSLKTKLIDPMPWLVRINLPDHEREFRRWQEEEIQIDLITALKFLSTIALRNSDLQINLERSKNNDILLANAEGITNPIALFELELFINLYNDDKVLFLFDDFNAICPHYEKEVIKILNILNDSEKRMWITTCSYKHTKLALEREFGTPYTLQPLDVEGKKSFLNRFYRTNLRLEKLNYDQFENIYSFMKYVSKSLQLTREPNREFVPVLSLLFHYVYISAATFFESEINHVSPSILNDKFKEEFDIDFNQYTPIDTALGRTPNDDELELAGTPLHIYMAANYFKCRIEDCFAFVLNEAECKNKWELIMNTFTLYKNFIEDEMKRFLEKDYEVSSDEERSLSSFGYNRREFINKHKKLGLFTICRENDLTKLLKEEEIIEVKDTIRKIATGEEKSCFIDCVVDDMPRFGHLIFAEYFAMEGLADMMKQLLEHDTAENPLKNTSLWHSVLNILLFNAPPGLRSALNYKLESDSAFTKVANSDICKKTLFEILLKENRAVKEGTSSRETPPLTEALQDRLFNVVNLFLSTAQCNLNRGNVDEVIDLVKQSHTILSNFRSEYADLLESVGDSIKNLDMRKLSRIIESGAFTEVPLRHANEYCSSPAVGDLTRRVASTTEQLPALVQSIQQICIGAANMAPAIGDALVSVAERGMQAYLDDFLRRLHDQSE